MAIVILNWNGLEYLKRFLPGVVSHSGMQGTSIWVVDNGSTDDSAGWIESNFREVNLLRFKTNYGYAGGYARALDLIEASYYVLLNSDVEVTPGWIEGLFAFMEANPSAAACQPKVLSYHDRSHFEHAGAAGGFIDKYGYPFCRGRIFGITEEDNGQYNNTMPVFWATGACMMVRSSSYREAGGLDDSFFAHMEEIDLCWRFHRLGYTVHAVTDTPIYHIGGGSLQYDTPGKTYLNFRNNLYMLYKNLPPAGFRIRLFARKMFDGAAAIMFLLSGKPLHFTAVLRAHRDYYRASGRLRATRNRLAVTLPYGKVPANLILNKSIVLMFYLNRVRRFSDIMF